MMKDLNLKENPLPEGDEFHDWLSQCPNNWVRLAVDKDSSTYMFYRNDDEEED